MATRTEQQSTRIHAREHRGYYNYVHNTNSTYSMVSTPRRILHSTPAGGTLPLITFLQIAQFYRYNKLLNKPTNYPITTLSLLTYLSPASPPRPRSIPTPTLPTYRNLCHQSAQPTPSTPAAPPSPVEKKN
jgi:hypothetical protein